MPVARKLVSIPNALESIWTIFIIQSGFTFNVYNPLFIPPGISYTAPWWLLPLVLLQLVLAVILLGVAIGSVFESSVAYTVGALCSAGMLITYMPILLAMNAYFIVAMAFSVFALISNLLALRRF